MATRKVKRYDGEAGSYVEDDAVPTAEQNAKNAEDAGTIELERIRDEAAKPVARATPKATSKAASSSGVTRMSKEAGEAAQAKFRESAKPAAKKEMYRDFSGKMREKAPDTSAADAAANRDRAWNAIKGAASSVGDYLSGLGRREEKHGTYVRNGKVERYAKGGMTASKRADGIATKGKTKGRFV